MFKKILLATDGSSHAQKALKYAQELALRDNAQVVIVHAIEPITSYMVYEEPSWLDQILTVRTAAGKKMVNEAAEKLRAAGIDVSTEILEGPPADIILRVADRCQADLIVMGSRGRGGMARLLLGSVSHRVMGHSRIPVLVIRAADGHDNSKDEVPRDE